MFKLMKKHYLGVIIITLILVFIVCFIWIACEHRWKWTGFVAYDTTTITNGNEIIETHPAKTLWDVLDLIIIPAVLAISAFLLNRSQTMNEQAIALNQEQEVLLQGYIDAMTELVLEKRLRSSKDDFEQDIDLRNIARSRTLTVLRALETPYKSRKNRRRGSILRFLFETQLIRGAEPVISLKKANLNESYLRKFDLRNVNLEGAYLYKADLRGAELQGANLEGAYLNKADLRGADLSGAKLNDSSLHGAIYGKYEKGLTKWPENFNYHQAGAVIKKREKKDYQRI